MLPTNTSIVKMWLIKELHRNLLNFWFRNSFWPNKNCNFVLIFVRDLIAMDSPLKLASRQGILPYDIALFYRYCMYERIYLVLSSPKSIDSFLSTNQSHVFANSLFKTFWIFVTSRCWQKILVLSFFSIWVFFHVYSRFLGKQGGGGHLFNSSLPLPPTSQTLRY